MDPILDALLIETKAINQFREMFIGIERAVRHRLTVGTAPEPGSLEEIWAGSPRRRFYACTSITISLYGAVERFIEDLIESYVMTLGCRARSFSDLPDEIRKHHLPKSLELLSRIQHASYRGTTTVSKVVANLHGTLAQNEGQALNSTAFATHRPNIRPRVVDELFEHVGVKGICSRAYRLEYASDRIGGGRETPWRLIDELAERRNEISHGVTSDFLGLELLGEYIAEIEVFCAAVHEVANSEALRPVVKYHALKLPKAEKVINHNIVCLSNGGHSIVQDDSLIAETGDPALPFRIGRIKKIEIDGSEVQSIPEGEMVLVGLEVEMRTKQNHQHHLVPSGVLNRIDKRSWN
jgi:hypothetical protein